jgi:hypothetical protein
MNRDHPLALPSPQLANPLVGRREVGDDRHREHGPRQNNGTSTREEELPTRTSDARALDGSRRRDGRNVNQAGHDRDLPSPDERATTGAMLPRDRVRKAAGTARSPRGLPRQKIHDCPEAGDDAENGQHNERQDQKLAGANGHVRSA